MATKQITVELRGGYSLQQLERAIKDLTPLLELDHPARVRLDLSHLAFIGPTALALLEAALRRLEHLEYLIPGGAIVQPNSPMTAMYLQRMDVYRGLASAGAVSEDFKRRKPSGFRPITQFDADAVTMTAKELSEALQEKCQTDAVASAAIFVSISELADNVIHHADTPLGGFCGAQGFSKKPEFELGIVDLGVGIRGSLIRNPAHADVKDDVTAIERALQPRVTSNPKFNSGNGLFITKLLLKRNTGALLVRSGRGKVLGGGDDHAETVERDFQGTIVSMRAHTERPLDVNAIYAELDRLRKRGKV